MFDLATEKIIKENLPIGLIQPKRAQIYIGFQCHQKCGFCYYIHKCNEKMFTFDQIKQQIDFEYDYGIREFEITGGEPSESTILLDVCKYIKNKDQQCKIAIITNGGLYKHNIWKIIDEILISYHLGKNDITYNANIFPLGNTYYKVKKTIDLAKTNNIIVRINTVLGTFNLNSIQYILDDLVEFKPYIINFLPVNLFDQAKDMYQYIDYDLFREKIKYAIDFLNKNIMTTINIRYMPFCNMQGYEQHIIGTLQHVYDRYDWNRELDGINVITMAKAKDFYLKILGKYGSTSISTALSIRKNTYYKSKKCLCCKYNIICDGVEKTKNNVLEKYIMPTNGKIIKNILYYVR